MTGYFDKLDHAVTTLSRLCLGDCNNDLFVREVGCVEKDMIEQVSLVTGDREFPDDLRERMQGAIACWAVCDISVPPRKQTISILIATRRSRLVMDLHSMFHELAGRRIVTRFGLLDDSPSSILKKRDAYDQETH